MLLENVGKQRQLLQPNKYHIFGSTRKSEKKIKWKTFWSTCLMADLMQWDSSMSTSSKWWPYGPAQAHPPLAWIPNKSHNNLATNRPCSGLLWLEVTSCIQSSSLSSEELWYIFEADPEYTKNEKIGSRSTSVLPKTTMFGFLESRFIASLAKACSRILIRSNPMYSFTQNASAARTFCMIGGVPASSLSSMSS